MNMRTKTGSAKSIYLLFALSFMAFFGIVLALWDRQSEQKGKPEAIKTTEKVKQGLPETPKTHQKPPSIDPVEKYQHTPELPEIWQSKTDLETIEGELTIVDACSGIISVDGVTLDSQYLSFIGIQSGDHVEVLYKDENHGKVAMYIRKLPLDHFEP